MPLAQDNSTITLPADGRTVTTLSAYLANNAVVNVKDYGAIGDGLSHPLSTVYGTGAAGLAAARVVYPHATDPANELDWAAIQKAFNAVNVIDGLHIVIPNGKYLINETLEIPEEQNTSQGRTFTVQGLGEAILHNTATAGKPTIRYLGEPGSGTWARHLTLDGIVFTNLSANANHAVHWRGVLMSAIRNCVFCIQGGNPFYCDGGVFDLVFEGNKAWPGSHRHYAGSPATGSPKTMFLFDTPFSVSFAFANTLTFRDNAAENGGCGIELKPGYGNNLLGWYIGRHLFEGLSNGTDHWGLKLDGLRGGVIEAIYGEANSEVSGDVNDQHILLENCAGLTVIGTEGTGTFRMRGCERCLLLANTANAFDVDATNSGCTFINYRHSIAGGAGTALHNIAATNSVEWGAQGTGAVSGIFSIPGQLKFPAVAVPSVDPNTLDDYEEVTSWTPVVSGSGTAGTYQLDAVTSCTAQKIGNRMHITARIVLAAMVTGGGTGDVRIAGLPASLGDTAYTGFAPAIVNGIAFTGSFVAVERVSGLVTDTLFLYGVSNTGAAAPVPIANVGADDQILFELSYIVA